MHRHLITRTALSVLHHLTTLFATVACAVTPVEPTDETGDDLTCDTSHIGRHLGPLPLSPCPGTTLCRIMPMGDSITDGSGLPDGQGGLTSGYRPVLWHMLSHMNVTFVGSLASGPDLVDGATWPRAHEGHSGWSIDAVGSIMTGLQVIAADRIAAYQPDVVLLMVGTNDVQLGLDDGAQERLQRLVDTIRATKSDVVVLLSTILPTQDVAQNVRVDAFNEAVTRVQGVTRVDAHAAFAGHPEYLADKLHPTDAGYAVLASVWFTALTRAQ